MGSADGSCLYHSRASEWYAVVQQATMRNCCWLIHDARKKSIVLAQIKSSKFRFEHYSPLNSLRDDSACRITIAWLVRTLIALCSFVVTTAAAALVAHQSLAPMHGSMD